MTWGTRRLPWPHNLTAGQVRCIVAVHKHGTQDRAAMALQLSVRTVAMHLETARRRAGVTTTADLVDRYLATIAPARVLEAA